MADSSTLRLYNTLTREKEDFVPLDRKRVRMYACGPTVYDLAHIGNGRMAVVFDLLFRLLKFVYGEENVVYVRNITDVDDKINARAARDYPDLPLNDAIRKVTEQTAAQYERDVTALGTLPPTIEPRATENIAQMQAMIKKLIDRGHAYQAGGEVLFDVGSMPDYGKLSRRQLDEQKAGARVAVEAHKHNPEDFVLWKLSSAEEPGWPSPWGRGRPGWHIECSAMSERFLGQVFDIHGGGLDLIFPHHENEIAQSRCAHGTDVMARYWVHNGFLQLEGRKMSKSEGNFVTIHDLVETENFGKRKWPGEVVRLALLMTHYREPLDFTVVRLEEAEQKLRDWQRAAGAATKGAIAPPDLAVVTELLDDLNFHRASVALDAVAREANRGVLAAADSLGATLDFLGFGLDSLLQPETISTELAVDIEEQVNRRLTALNTKDFATADRIRADLAAQGIQLMDYRDSGGDRQTRWEVKS